MDTLAEFLREFRASNEVVDCVDFLEEGRARRVEDREGCSKQRHRVVVKPETDEHADQTRKLLLHAETVDVAVTWNKTRYLYLKDMAYTECMSVCLECGCSFKPVLVMVAVAQ